MPSHRLDSCEGIIFYRSNGKERSSRIDAMIKTSENSEKDISDKPIILKKEDRASSYVIEPAIDALEGQMLVAIKKIQSQYKLKLLKREA